MPNFKPKEHPEDEQNIWNVALPIDVDWGVYARQSTLAQVKNNIQSTEMQTDELIAWLVVRGIQNERIALFDADLGVSGTKRIDERTGLQELVEKIKQGKINAVLVYQISRLFRDETGVQYNVFADICKKNNCLLVTADGMIFNFKNPMHMKMFRFLAEMAAEYIPQQIGLLIQARERKARKGLYAGMGTIPKGLIVDYNEKSRTYEKYIVYKPHAKVVLSFFERFYELDGNLGALCRELEEKPVLFPFFDETVDKRVISRVRWKKVEGGYHITRSGLILLLTNPVYLGWWIVKGDIVSRDNHERIIPKEKEYLFWFAFNCLANHTIDGELNNKRKIRRRFYQLRTEQTAGILKDRICGIDGPVYVHAQRTKTNYSIKDLTRKVERRFSRDASTKVIDEAFLCRFFEHLRSAHEFDNYRQYVKDLEEKKSSALDTLTSQLEQAEKQKKDCSDEVKSIRREINDRAEEKVCADPNLDIETVAQEIEKEYAAWLRDLRKSIADLESTKTALQAKVNELTNGGKQNPIASFYGEFHEELEVLVKTWESKSFKQRKEFINLFVEQAILSAASTHWMRLDIHWTLPGWESETLFIYLVKGQLIVWKDHEREILKQYYATVDKTTLLSLLPNKTWDGIKKEAVRQHIHRGYTHHCCPVPDGTTWEDYQLTQRMGIGASVRDTIYVPLLRRKR